MSSGSIFVNYRRDDAGGYAGWLFTRLEQAFPIDQLFMDVEGHIRAGEDYANVLRAEVAKCDVLLAIIGPQWLIIADTSGRRRIDNPDDWVRLEIAAALEAGVSKRVIPVLIGDTSMPRVEDLPADIAALVSKQATRIRIERFNADVNGLLEQVRNVLTDLEQRRSSQAAERAAEAHAKQTREAEEQARRALADVRAREQDFARLSSEEIRRIEEFASWDHVKGTGSIDDIRRHLTRFSEGHTKQYAVAILEDLIWKTLSVSAEISELRNFVEEFPSGANTRNAQKLLAEAERIKNADAEHVAWTKICAEPTTTQLAQFIKEYPNGNHSEVARKTLVKIADRWRRYRMQVIMEHLLISFLALLLVGVVVGAVIVFPVGAIMSLNNLLGGSAKSEADIGYAVRDIVLAVLVPVALYRAYRLLVVIRYKQVPTSYE
jgi:TolA-binding protein